VLALTWNSTRDAAVGVLAALLAVVIRALLRLRDRVTRLEALDERQQRKDRS
jgi:hypothetical protein